MTADLKAWFSAGSRFDFNGYNIFYRRSSGKKQSTVLLIHGFPTASFDFAPIWNSLAKQYTLIAPDMLGFGFSAKPRAHSYSLIEQADLIEALLAREKIPNYHILAHDYGVSVAQELLSRQMGKKKPALSVCFLNGGLYPEFHKPLLVQQLLAGPLGALLGRFFTKRKLRASFDTIFGSNKPSAADIDNFWDLITHNRGKSAVPRLLSYMNERKRNRDRWVHAMESTRIPVQMLNGPEDPISGAHLAAAFAERNPHAEVHSLAGIGHYPQVEAPQAVAKLFLDFLKRNGA